MLPFPRKTGVTEGTGTLAGNIEQLGSGISHVDMSSTTPFVAEQTPGKRRSRRIKVPMNVRIAPADPTADPAGFRAIATNLNRFGALVSSEQEFKVGSHVFLTNPKREQALAIVVGESRPLRQQRQYGIEFTDGSAGATFWGITFLGQEKG